ncbi:MAG TPA: fused MFS/spermidine synthase [Thermoanaerobaculia bacterium]|nr:fused MFS/spermidine synthase [Thermoanaerobaculia bacterium]HUM29135.1 fused MFS/spermidine synthase [Thermoanaerobaculia bacterium]HXK67512.1 fused MFS/spermidine synthase [Thermoanaerobaculia bacterium]
MKETKPEVLKQNISTFFLMVTAILCGGLIMVIEILGSRIIGPYFGVSLFVWTSMITVTLLALAAGYYAGGIFSDRGRNPDHLYQLILGAGIYCLLVPLIKIPVLTAFQSSGLRVGSLLVSSILFGPPLALLGCVSPFVIKLYTKELKRLGRNVGFFYAISTFGSFAGTVLTGFVLIAHFRVSRIMQFVGVLLILLSVVYFLCFRKKIVILTAFLPLLLLSFSTENYSVLLQNGTRATQVYTADSYYGNLQVIDFSYGPIHTRELMIDGLVQGGIDMRSRLSIYPYSYYLQLIPISMKPQGDRCLVIGLGAGIVATWYGHQGITTDVVDIDSEVIRIAREYFQFGATGEVASEDARYFLAKSNKTYDYIILDAFTGDSTPSHLLTLEALTLVKQRMAGDGIAAMNIIGSLDHNSYMTKSVIKTIRHVFENVDVIPLYEQATPDAYGNIILIAYDGTKRDVDISVVNRYPIHPIPEKSVVKYFGRIHPIDSNEGLVLTDEYNPYNIKDLWLKEKLRESIIASLPLKLLAV